MWNKWWKWKFSNFSINFNSKTAKYQEKSLKVDNVGKQTGNREWLEWAISEIVQIFGILIDWTIYCLNGIKITFYEMMLGDCWKKLKVMYFAADIALSRQQLFKYNFWPHFWDLHPRYICLPWKQILQFYYLVYNYKNTYPSILIFHFSPYTPKITTYIHLFTYLSLLTQ